MSSSLVVGDWVVARSEGSLEIEYALFDASEVLLAAAVSGFGVREQGYLTTASIARHRLDAMGATVDLAREAFRALGRRESLARTASIARVSGELGPCEAFQGGVYDSKQRHYAGTWLDLDALARACEMENAAFAMQLVHLAMVVADVPEDTPVRLFTETDHAKANQRTWRRVSVPTLLRDLPHALSRIPSAIASQVANEADVNAEVASDLRARSALSRDQARLEAIASALGKTFDAHDSERAVQTARAWRASGELAYARYTARAVTQDAKATAGARALAGELLDSTATTNESVRPPPVAAPAVAVDERPSQQIPLASPSRPAPEVVETMPLPEGDETRVELTKLARELARDYRLAYGTTLKTDPVAIEAMQRHLRRRFIDAKRDEQKARTLDTEITRHGALFSEILARMLGARWIETQGDDPGGWSMMVPPNTRVWPIGRVHRFLQQGSRESDLVAFYFELERSARR